MQDYLVVLFEVAALVEMFDLPDEGVALTLRFLLEALIFLLDLLLVLTFESLSRLGVLIFSLDLHLVLTFESFSRLGVLISSLDLFNFVIISFEFLN